MYIIAHWNGHGIRVGCIICGEGFDLGKVAYDAVTEDAPHEMLGAVCGACVVLSEAERRQRLRGAAEALRQEAERLDAWAAPRSQLQGLPPCEILVAGARGAGALLAVPTIRLGPGSRRWVGHGRPPRWRRSRRTPRTGECCG
jgi:hypothetical protein